MSFALEPDSSALLTARDEVLAAMQARPHNPWPRGQAHAILAFPVSRENEKSYHEPGGSFSPFRTTRLKIEQVAA